MIEYAPASYLTGLRTPQQREAVLRHGSRYLEHTRHLNSRGLPRHKLLEPPGLIRHTYPGCTSCCGGGTNCVIKCPACAHVPFFYTLVASGFTGTNCSRFNTTGLQLYYTAPTVHADQCDWFSYYAQSGLSAFYTARLKQDQTTLLWTVYLTNLNNNQQVLYTLAGASFVCGDPNTAVTNTFNYSSGGALCTAFPATVTVTNSLQYAICNSCIGSIGGTGTGPNVFYVHSPCTSHPCLNGSFPLYWDGIPDPMQPSRLCWTSRDTGLCQGNDNSGPTWYYPTAISGAGQCDLGLWCDHTQPIQDVNRHQVGTVTQQPWREDIIPLTGAVAPICNGQPVTWSGNLQFLLTP